MRAITGLATRLTTLSVALWLAFTPIAHADTGSDFLNALTQLGIGYQDPSKTIDRGRVVCSAITTGGFSYTETVYGMARMSGSTVAAENGFAAVAVGFFCHDQEPLVMAAQSSFPPDARVVLTP